MTTFFESALSTFRVPIERDRTIVPALVAQQDLDALLGSIEDPRTRPGEPHSLFERRQRLLEREIARLEPLDDATQLREHLIEPRVGGLLFRLRHLTIPRKPLGLV